MPIIEFRCGSGHITEKVFTTAAEAETGSSPIICTKCVTGSFRPASLAYRVEHSLTARPRFSGEGWTPRFHTPGESHIGGVPVKKGDDPNDVAKKVVAAAGGGKGLVQTVKGVR